MKNNKHSCSGSNCLAVSSRMVFSFLICFCFVMVADAQNLFQHIYGGLKNDEAVSAIRAHETGYLIAGTTESFSSGDDGLTDFYLVRTNEVGSVIWSKAIDVGDFDDAAWMEQTPDAYVLCGTAAFSNGNSYAVLIKINDQGTLLWQKRYSINDFMLGSCVRTTDDGGFILSGSVVDADDDHLLLKLDSEGNVLWIKKYSFDGYSFDFAQYQTQTDDGGFLFAGSAYYSFFWGHIFIAKTDSEGNIEWARYYNSFPSFEKCTVSKIFAVSDGYLVSGSINYLQPLSDILLLKLDQQGNILWSKTYGGGDNEISSGMVKLKNNFVISGSTASAGISGYNDALLFSVDSSGNVLWSKAWGRDEIEDNTESIISPNDGGFLLSGSTSAFSVDGTLDMMAIKTDSLGFAGDCNVFDPVLDVTEITLEDSVNPITSMLEIDVSDVAVVENSGVSDSVLCAVFTSSFEPVHQSGADFIIHEEDNGEIIITPIGFENGRVQVRVFNSIGQLLIEGVTIDRQPISFKLHNAAINVINVAGKHGSVTRKYLDKTALLSY